ncbi:MAG TPA: hydrogenase maturation protease [Bryobacteraceae bacterium]|jgi:hydrogenase maturation protease|nr:hydrogenase maturation protease [Bryobacteraceae bacterium]
MNEWEWQLLEEKLPVESVMVQGVAVAKGDCVVLRPRPGGDIFDLALAGRAAIVESIEQDYEGKLHLAVILEEDPGKDLGLLRQPGHRFFFTPEEVERCTRDNDALAPRTRSPQILVACIGNIFLGDDGFGVEVARQLSNRTFPENVRIRDFGIRGYDLAYALLEGDDLVILVDACPRGEAAGTVYVIETDAAAAGSPAALDAHTMNPVAVIQLAKSMGPVSKRILLVGCEPATLGGEDGEMGLSEPVSAAVGEAVKVVERLVAEALIAGETSPPAYGT